MRNRTLVALALLAAASATAWAGPLQIPCGKDPIEISLFGSASLYESTGDGVLESAPRAYDDPTILPGDELRGIGYIDAVSYLDNDGQQQTGYTKSLAGFELTGCYHGLEVKTAQTRQGFWGSTEVFIEYVPSADQQVNSLQDEDGNLIEGAGGRATFYLDHTPDFAWDPDNPTPATDPVTGLPYEVGVPDNWRESDEARLDFGTAGKYDAEGNDELGEDVSLLFDGVFVPLANLGYNVDPDVVLIAKLELFPNGTGNGWALGFMNSIRDGIGPATNKVEYHTTSTGGTVLPDGIAEFMFPGQGEGTGADFRFAMQLGYGPDRSTRLYYPAETGWTFSNNDPIEFINTPEPATSLLFGIPLGVLLRRLRRRRRS